MRRLVHLIPGLLLVGAACSTNGTTATATTPLESCYDTGGGHMRCVATPNGADTTSHDVDDDGKADTFVCVTGGKADDGEEDDKAETETGDGGKTESSDNNDDKNGTCDGGKTEANHAGDSHDGGKAEGDDDHEGKGAPRCENMGCQDMRKKMGEGEDDNGDRTANDGGPKKGDDQAEGSDHEHEDGRANDMMCPTTPPPPTTPPVVPAPAVP